MHQISKSLKYPLLRSTFCNKITNDTATNNLDWYKVGKIEKLYIYPMFEGSMLYTPECTYTNCGMSGMLENSYYRNHMFIVYNCKTNCIIKAIDNVMIRSISVKNLGNGKIQIAFMESVITLNIWCIVMNELVTCSTPSCHAFERYKRIVVMCFDCGSEAAEWISRCLNDKNARLGFCKVENSRCKTPTWKQLCNAQVEHLYSRELEKCFETISTKSLSDYKLMPILDYSLLSENMTRVLQPQVLRPNIIIKADKFNDILEWDWIMIGSTILRNTNPMPRSTTEPNFKIIPIKILSDIIPLRCNLFFPGSMQVGDDVLVKKAPPIEEFSITF